MSYNTLKTVIKAVINNNEINGGNWSDWDNSRDIIELYAEDALTEQEIEVLDSAIETNGESLYADIEKMQHAEWGVNFGGGGSFLDSLTTTRD